MVNLIKLLALVSFVAVFSGCATREKPLPAPTPPLVTSPVGDITGARTSVANADVKLVEAQETARKVHQEGTLPFSEESRELSDIVTQAREDLKEANTLLVQAETRAIDVDKERERFYQNWQNAHHAFDKEKEKSVAVDTLRKQAVRHRNILAAILSVLLLGGLFLVISKFYARGGIF